MAEVQEPRNALWRREDQLKRWNISETNKESAERRDNSKTKVQFQDGCVFLAACASGDKDEVEKLLARGADINTANVDGLTALHQACIDDNIDMVKFLVEHGAGIDACDNEGWTPLHATASCGVLDIAKYLIDKGANVAAVNIDGELPLDIAEGDDMDQMLSDEMERLGIDAEAARQEEEELMERHAQQWINAGKVDEKPHPKTGATCLHVAAAKGYIKVMKLLLQVKADVDVKDVDGWTPLHAAAHWGQEEACRILVDHFCNMDAKNQVGQTALDICEPNLRPLLEELKVRQASLKKDRESDLKDTILSRPPPLKRRSSVTRMSVDQKQNVIMKNMKEEGAELENIKKIGFVEKDEEVPEEKKSESSTSEDSNSEADETEKQNEINTRQSTIAKTEEKEVPPDKPRVDKEESPPRIENKEEEKEEESSSDESDESTDSESKESSPEPKVMTPQEPSPTTPRISDIARTQESNKENKELNVIEEEKPDKLPSKEDAKRSDEDTFPALPPRSILLRTLSFPSSKSTLSGRQTSSYKPVSQPISEEPSSWRAGLRKMGSSSAVPESTRSILREPDSLSRSASSPWLASDKKTNNDTSRRRPFSTTGIAETQEEKNRFNDFYTRYTSLLNNKVTTASTSTASTTSPSATSTNATTSVSTYAPSYVPLLRRRQLEAGDTTTVTSLTRPSTISSVSALTSPTSPTGSTTTALSRRPVTSYEPPKRDEERETERKAKAKRARETRRSTQGVTKEDLLRAEQTLQAAKDGKEPPPDPSLSDDKDKENKPEDILRRPRLHDDKDEPRNSYSSRRLRDSGLSTDTTGSSNSRTSGLRTTSGSNIPSTLGTSRTSTSVTATGSSSLGSGDATSLYRSYKDSRKEEEDSKKEDDKDKEKEDPSQKSAAIRNRRKRESRRPTGKITAEDIHGITKENSEESSKENKEKKDDEDKSSSRYGLSRYSEPTGSGLYDRTSSSSYTSRPDRTYSSYTPTTRSSSASSLEKDMDYKKLYEDEKLENEKLRRDLKKTQAELADVKLEVASLRSKNDTSRSIAETADKRERRALERKISELEEELKVMENLKTDNMKLKEENGALIRVISKLSK